MVETTHNFHPIFTKNIGPKTGKMNVLNIDFSCGPKLTDPLVFSGPFKEQRKKKTAATELLRKQVQHQLSTLYKMTYTVVVLCTTP